MVSVKEFKGNKVLVLTDDRNEKNFVSFGYNKAKLILSAIKDIEKFVADNTKK
jgi:hypothetical protein